MERVVLYGGILLGGMLCGIPRTNMLVTNALVLCQRERWWFVRYGWFGKLRFQGTRRGLHCLERYGGHLRPYLWVTCDPTPLKPKTGSLATLPLFTAPATQNYTWSLATLPTTTRENPARSLATLPTQIGRVTSDHEPHTLHTFAFVRPYLTSFYQNFPSPLQPMLSTTFLLSKTFLLSQFSPPSAAHAFNYNIPFIKNITFITISPPLQPMLSTTTFLLSKTFFLPKFSPPLQPMLSTTFLLSKTFLLSQFSPPSAAHAFNYNIPFIKNITFITISPPSAAHNIADTHLPLCDPTWLPFITIFPPLCSQCFQLQHSFYQKHSFYHNFPPPPLQPTT